VLTLRCWPSTPVSRPSSRRWNTPSGSLPLQLIRRSLLSRDRTSCPSMPDQHSRERASRPPPFSRILSPRRLCRRRPQRTRRSQEDALEVSIMVLRRRLKAVFYEATTCSELSIPVCNGRIPSSPRRYLQALSNAIKAVVSQSVCPLIRLLNITNCSAHKETTGCATPTAPKDRPRI
jgi:hypothetical protein